MKEKDVIRRFMFEQADVRGAFVHLDATWRAVEDRKQYPEVVRRQLGEFLTAGALLASTLKFDGSMIMQIQGDGPISLMVVEATSERTLRGIAKWEGEFENNGLKSLYGNGRLVITIDNGRSTERYQGIVELEGESLSDALQNYLIRSEQLDTQIWLANDGVQATGMLLQKMPQDKGIDIDFWNRIVHLASTIHDEELKKLSAEEILHRLFNEDDLRLFDAEPVCFRCSCTNERVANMLRSLGQAEVDSIIEEQGSVEIDCEYCGQHYSYDKVDAAELFVTDLPGGVSTSTRH